jgi:glycosyltransferase involved in cell wall biosynthesis
VLHRWFIPRFDACLAVGTWSEEYFCQYGAQQIFRVPHSIDHSRFAPRPPGTPDSSVRSAFGLRDDTTVFLFAGKFIERKRPLDFVRAVGAAARQVPSIAGIMVGDGHLRREVEQYVTAHKLAVQLTGFMNQSELPRAYRAADALVLPSDGRETWGLVVNEAMAAGLPCIVSDQAGCGPDLVVSGRTGHLYPLGAVDELARLMVRYGTMRHHLQVMGHSARLHEEQFTRSAVDGFVAAVEAVSRGQSRGR